jgi:hypothetical protein
LQDNGLRNLGAIVPGARTEPPQAAAPPARPPVSPQSGAKAVAPANPPPALAAPPGAAMEVPLFAADVADGSAALRAGAVDLDAPLALLAELASHGRTQTPFTIGLLGPAGCGKSVALNRLVAAIERLGAAARAAGSGPFLADIATVRLDAAALDGAAAEALAGALYERLAAVAPGLAGEAHHAARDPALAAREAFDRLDAARRKLDSERRALDESDARRAKLAQSLLYDTPGSQIDAYAQARRGRLRAEMSSFGVVGDPIQGFKDMVAEVADGGGASFALRAFWGLKGQARLIVTAVILALTGLGLGAAFDNQAVWLGQLRAQPQSAGAADWIAANAGWLLTLRTAAYLGAALALALNVWRAARLLQTVFRGETLLNAELSGRRRDSDGDFGHQARRVETLAAEVERLSRQAAEAERRAGGAPRAVGPAPAEPSPFAADAVRSQAQRFLAAAGTLAQTRGAGTSLQAADAPRRIIVALDGLDLVSPARSAEILLKMKSLLGPGYVSLIALDPARFLREPEAPRLDRWIQAPLQVGEIAARRDAAAQIRDLLGAAPEAKPAASPVDARQSALDEPLTDTETRLLAALAPLAGPSARSVKRFVNLYRLLRAQWRDRPEQRGALAFMLALDAGGDRGDADAVNKLLAAGGDAAFAPPQFGPRLASAFAALGEAQSAPSLDSLRRAAAQVRVFSFGQAGAEARG